MQFSTYFVTALAAVAYAAPSQLSMRENKDVAKQQDDAAKQQQQDAAKQQQQDAAKQQEDAAKQQQEDAAKQEAAKQFDLGQLNNGQFNNLDLAYLNVVNKVDIQGLAALAVQQNLNLAAFANIFNAQALDLNAILQLQQLVQIQQLQQLGLLGGIDLAALQLNALNLGAIGNIGGVNLQQFINAGVKNQVQAVVSGANVIVISQ
ncbi:hypothetical protein PG993_003519 [Apiospora rasikravindrae]|uniref:Uncharacterized protein n=1 Tax=Apiospora rasikravindrae TaxID=990691 RepID=A0ABR1TZT1_9PEZI